MVDKLMLCSVGFILRSANESRKKIEDLKDVDICSDTFNQSRAVDLMMSRGGRMVCDVLLDQLILPGVGNIIKNEVSVLKGQYG